MDAPPSQPFQGQGLASVNALYLGVVLQPPDLAYKSLPIRFAITSVVQPAMAVRAQCCRVIYLVWATLGERSNMVHFQPGLSLVIAEWRHTATALTMAR